MQGNNWTYKRLKKYGIKLSLKNPYNNIVLTVTFLEVSMYDIKCIYTINNNNKDIEKNIDLAVDNFMKSYIKKIRLLKLKQLRYD